MAIVTAENLTKHYGAGTNLTKRSTAFPSLSQKGNSPPSQAHPAAGNPPCCICLAVLTGRLPAESKSAARIYMQ